MKGPFEYYDIESLYRSKNMGDFRNEEHIERLYALTKDGKADKRGLIIYYDYRELDELLKQLQKEKFQSWVVTRLGAGRCRINNMEVKLAHELDVNGLRGVRCDWYIWISRYPVSSILNMVENLKNSFNGHKFSFTVGKMSGSREGRKVTSDE